MVTPVSPSVGFTELVCSAIDVALLRRTPATHVPGDMSRRPHDREQCIVSLAECTGCFLGRRAKNRQQAQPHADADVVAETSSSSSRSTNPGGGVADGSRSSSPRGRRSPRLRTVGASAGGSRARPAWSSLPCPSDPSCRLGRKCLLAQCPTRSTFL